jgi:hypothetical protein
MGLGVVGAVQEVGGVQEVRINHGDHGILKRKSPFSQPRTQLDKSSQHYCTLWLLLCAVTCRIYQSTPLVGARFFGYRETPCAPW